MTGRAAAVRPSQARKEGRSPAGLADRPRGPGIRLQGPGGSQGSGTAVQCAEGGAGCRPPGLHRPAGVRPLPPAPRFIARAPRGPFQTRAASSDFLPVAATLGKRASWCPLHFALSLCLSLSLSLSLELSDVPRLGMHSSCFGGAAGWGRVPALAGRTQFTLLHFRTCTAGAPPPPGSS